MTGTGKRGTIVVDHGDHGASVVLDETVAQGVAAQIDGKDLAQDGHTRFSDHDRVVITSENVLDSVLSRLDDPERRRLIDALKNKDRCRELMAARYPDFFYRRLPLADLPGLTLPGNGRFVVKPNRGYFATAIKIVTGDSDLTAIRREIEEEVHRNAAVFADTVLSDADVIVEEFIEGEEYAVDMFFDAAGEPVIVNIYHHPIPENPDYLHALYYTSKPVFDRLLGPLTDWFRDFNTALGAKGFPIHGEFKLGDKGLVPIELNPLRYGGDGLVDLAYHAFGLNPYVAFVTDQAPDWGAIWRGREDKIYTWMMGYVGTEVDVASHRPNMGEFQSLFSNILSDTLLNYEAHLGFSVVYSEETDIDTVNRLVNTDFKQFFLGSRAFTDGALTKLYRCGVRAHFAGGEWIWREGDHGDYMLLVIDGTLDVLNETAGLEPILLDSVGSQSVVGEFSVMDGKPRSAGVRAGADGCTAMKISGKAFRKLLREAPGLFEDLYWQQQTRIRKMNKRLGELEAELATLKGR